MQKLASSQDMGGFSN